MKIFVAHSTEDHKLIKNDIRPILLKYFFEDEIIILDKYESTGEHWPQVENGIKSCDVFIVLVTKNSKESPIVTNEINMALGRKGKVKILPILINTNQLGPFKPLLDHITPPIYYTSKKSSLSIEDHIVKVIGPTKIINRPGDIESPLKSNSKLFIEHWIIWSCMFIILCIVIFSYAMLSFNDPKIIIDTKPTINWTPQSEDLLSISGRIINLNDPENYIIVVYALTNYWYVQPFDNESITLVGAKGEWHLQTHAGGEYCVILARKTYIPEKTLTILPNKGGDIVEIITIP